VAARALQQTGRQEHVEARTQLAGSRPVVDEPMCAKTSLSVTPDSLLC
jgi:hypothetical protein